jgi:hypothetical protein
VAFLSDPERIWGRLKDVASGMAARDFGITDLQAGLIVSRIIEEERAFSTPPDARDYFAAELMRMADEKRSYRQAR